VNQRLPDKAERAALAGLPLPVDWERVRLYRVGCHGTDRWLRRLILALSRGRAIALGNHVFLPARCDTDIAVLAHELVHCGQYQAWGPWRYYSRGALAQLRELVHRLGWGPSPYSYRLDPEKPFHSYGMEQQAQLVEDAFRLSSRSKRSS
jgi:Domain of unknown function (DUF4157)